VKVEDDADDEPGWRGRFSALATELLHSSRMKAVEVLQRSAFPVREVMDLMRSQGQCEMRGRTNLLEAARPTRLAYGEIFAHLAIVTEAADQMGSLRELGENLGELIYIEDAWKDHGKDRQKGRFNPLPDDVEARKSMVIEVANRCLAQTASACRALRFHGEASLTQQLLLLALPTSTRRKFSMAAVPDHFGVIQDIAEEPKRKPQKKRSSDSQCCGCDEPDCCDCSDNDCSRCRGCDCNLCNCPAEQCHGCDCHGCNSCDGCCSSCDCHCH
jgi:uncharacterized protein DUF5685